MYITFIIRLHNITITTPKLIKTYGITYGKMNIQNNYVVFTQASEPIPRRLKLH